MRMEMPTIEEKMAATGRILAETSGVGGTAFRSFRAARRALGLKVVFAGTADCLLLAAVISSCFYGLWIVVAIDIPEISLVTLFVIAPVFFMMLHLLTLWKERICGTLDLLLSCKYTPVWLTAMRMFWSGLGTAAFNAAFAVSVALHPEISVTVPVDALRMVAYSSLSVCIYSALLLVVLIRAKGTGGYTLLPAIWLGALSVLLTLRGAAIDEAMRASPAYAAPLVVLGAIAVILFEMNSLLKSGRAIGAGKELTC